MRSLVIGLLTVGLAAASQAQTVEYRSRAGVEFRATPDTGPVARAEQALAADPRNVDKILALGIAQSVARDFHKAIQTFTRGMKIAPNNPLLYRQRGHRYISIGAFDKALADLTRGNKLDTTNYDILYHLGVAHFERGEFNKAASAFARAQRWAPNDNELAGASDWLWMSLSRANRPADAKNALLMITDALKITSATAYWQRLKLYRGVIAPDQVLTPADSAAVQVATLSFGVGNWYLTRGDTANAKIWFQKAVDSRGWPGFAFFASETELRKLR